MRISLSASLAVSVAVWIALTVGTGRALAGGVWVPEHMISAEKLGRVVPNARAVRNKISGHREYYIDSRYLNEKNAQQILLPQYSSQKVSQYNAYWHDKRNEAAINQYRQNRERFLAGLPPLGGKAEKQARPQPKPRPAAAAKSRQLAETSATANRVASKSTGPRAKSGAERAPTRSRRSVAAKADAPVAPTLPSTEASAPVPPLPPEQLPQGEAPRSLPERFVELQQGRAIIDAYKAQDAQLQQKIDRSQELSYKLSVKAFNETARDGFKKEQAELDPILPEVVKTQAELKVAITEGEKAQGAMEQQYRENFAARAEPFVFPKAPTVLITPCAPADASSDGTNPFCFHYQGAGEASPKVRFDGCLKDPSSEREISENKAYRSVIFQCYRRSGKDGKGIIPIAIEVVCNHQKLASNGGGALACLQEEVPPGAFTIAPADAAPAATQSGAAKQ